MEGEGLEGACQLLPTPHPPPHKFLQSAHQQPQNPHRHDNRGVEQYITSAAFEHVSLCIRCGEEEEEEREVWRGLWRDGEVCMGLWAAGEGKSKVVVWMGRRGLCGGNEKCG